MKFNTKCYILLCFLIPGLNAESYAQQFRNQAVDYRMAIDFDAGKHTFRGKQVLVYTNNSPDTLTKVFFHLYFNAFQPGSMMDLRSRTIEDPDRRVGNRIASLTEDEMGYHKIKNLTQAGKKLDYIVEGTVMEVTLNEPILPLSSSSFEMEFNSQVPVQIRRSGRNNAEGIDYSMAQWYPKIAEYDERGWHAHPYIGREFYAPWGNFEVAVTIDSKYVLAGSGILQNPNEIGYGYEDEGVKIGKRPKKLTWKFKAENVHDFVWAADPDYVHKKAPVDGGPMLHFFYQEGEKTSNWSLLPDYTVRAFNFIEENYGEYPWTDYSVIQGGDGGMEYPMATLITGERKLESLVGVTVHEILHSWYQGLLATNESYYAWMDEGFTSYAQDETLAVLFDVENPQENNYRAYRLLTESGKEEPLSTHSDHYTTNYAYSLASYIKGAVALAQMNYLIGKQATADALKRFYYQWRFKHPDANDWIRVFEKASGLELDWYLDYWINTTHTIDYGIEAVKTNGNSTTVQLRRVGKMPMPMEVTVTFTDGTRKMYYAPLVMMRGEKKNEAEYEREVLPDWPWTNPEYRFEIPTDMGSIRSVEIDESGFMADVNRANNIWEAN